MATLEPIPNVTKLSDRVIRVLGQNPGKFTLQGTNTYLIGTSNPYILIDTAEGRDEYIPVLEAALNNEAKPTDPSLPDVSDIIISHWHHDHIGGIPAVLELLQKRWASRNPSTPFPAPRLHKYPLSSSDIPTEQKKWDYLPKILNGLSKELYTPSPSGSILHDLHDGQIIKGNSASLRVLHTPGHTLDSISIYIPEDRALYTADTVLGQGTSVFDDLGLYLNSLNRMLSFTIDPPDSQPAADGDTINVAQVVLYPSHGPMVANGKETISMYIKHRLDREAQVVQLLAGPPQGEEAWSTWGIVKTLYKSYPENLWEPAMRGIDLHLRKLQEEKRIRKLDGEGKTSTWSLVSRTPSPSL
ncbi:lactamase [Coprinopsis cinerea okayama7|uniref:Lactamase n=1 Tax=Coprinopsis cinerea (strain Okayama-7 / 130 / ATCC MYA-4618 / FGSC 9003) TaxID=240176 RepID=D6RL00_COPC7|nr:lactamase [Coprinopsis cinerea okayama7\|eukprot:XP_002911954.1 lactamase [Coprinopsis cinerea okayama7\